MHLLKWQSEIFVSLAPFIPSYVWRKPWWYKKLPMRPRLLLLQIPRAGTSGQVGGLHPEVVQSRQARARQNPDVELLRLIGGYRSGWCPLGQTHTLLVPVFENHCLLFISSLAPSYSPYWNWMKLKLLSFFWRPQKTVPHYFSSVSQLGLPTVKMTLGETCHQKLLVLSHTF